MWLQLNNIQSHFGKRCGLKSLRNTITLIILLGTVYSYAQGGFKKRYYLQNSITSICLNTIEAPNGNFIMIGLTYDTLNKKAFNRLTIVGTNSLGVEQWRKNYGDSSFEYLWNFSSGKGVQDSTGFYQAFSVRGNGPRGFGVLMKFNYAGDTIWQKVYRDPDPLEDVLPYDVCKSVDNGYLITGFFQNWGASSYRKCMVIKTDKNGKELWRKKIGKAVPDAQDGRSIVQDSASKKIVVVGYQYIGNSTAWETHSNILILDSLGNKIVQTTFNNSRGGAFNRVIQLKDSYFLTCGSWLSGTDLNDTPLYEGLIVKFDASGGEIWKKKFDIGTYWNNMAFPYEMGNGNIMVLGYLDSSAFFTFGYISRMQITILDKSGNFLSRKLVGSFRSKDYNNSFEQPNSLSRTKDGGFVISSWFQKAFNPRPYSIVKLDSAFCDTTEQYCVEEALGFGYLHKVIGFNFEIYPNPANDFVNLRIDAPLEKEFSVTLVDLNGKEVKSAFLKPKEEVKLCTSSYAPGIYFLNVIYQGLLLETRKFVVIR